MMHRIDDFYTAWADRVSVWAGTWPHFTFWLILLLIWIAAGPSMGWGVDWQLWANSPTTIVELFLGILVLAAANRTERHIEHVLDRILAIEQSLLSDIESVDSEHHDGHTEQQEGTTDA